MPGAMKNKLFATAEASDEGKQLSLLDKKCRRYKLKLETDLQLLLGRKIQDGSLVRTLSLQSEAIYDALESMKNRPLEREDVDYIVMQVIPIDPPAKFIDKHASLDSLVQKYRAVNQLLAILSDDKLAALDRLQHFVKSFAHSREMIKENSKKILGHAVTFLADRGDVSSIAGDRLFKSHSQEINAAPSPDDDVALHNLKSHHKKSNSI